MDFRTTDTPSFQVVGKALRVTTKDGENLRRIPEFWEECLRDGSHDQLVKMAAHGVVLGNVTLGICADFAADGQEFTYMVAAETQGETVPVGMVVRTIPGGTWAVFEAVGPMPDAIQAIWGRIWSEFFPSQPFTHADGPDLELYPSGDSTQADYRFEVWVPIVTP